MNKEFNAEKESMSDFARQADENLRTYFSLNPDRLPLILAVFEQEKFKNLRGRDMRLATLQNLFNRTDLKQIEKTLINHVFSGNFEGLQKINYNQAENLVRKISQDNTEIAAEENELRRLVAFEILQTLDPDNPKYQSNNAENKKQEADLRQNSETEETKKQKARGR